MDPTKHRTQLINYLNCIDPQSGATHDLIRDEQGSIVTWPPFQQKHRTLELNFSDETVSLLYQHTSVFLL